MEDNDIIKALTALAQINRLQIFRSLVEAGPGGLTPGTLTRVLKLAPATLSFHLKELMHAGLISQQRSGRHLIYRSDRKHMTAVLAYLTENCCDTRTQLSHEELAFQV